MTDEGCPEGYHTIEDDESGQCCSNDIECPGDMIEKDSDNGDYYCGDQHNRAFEVALDICDEDAEVDKSGGDCEDAREDVNA
ncbi:MAG: hypothetical protein ACRD8Z_22535 [Nitrososphaeraceae archaeon]